MLEIPCSFLHSRSVFVSMLRGYYTPLTQHNWTDPITHTQNLQTPAFHTQTHTHKLPVSLSSTISLTHLLVPFPLYCCRSSGHTQHQPNSHKHSVSSTTGTFMSHGGFLITLTDFRFFKCLFYSILLFYPCRFSILKYKLKIKKYDLYYY